jgi:hypothetical protein
VHDTLVAVEGWDITRASTLSPGNAYVLRAVVTIEQELAFSDSLRPRLVFARGTRVTPCRAQDVIETAPPIQARDRAALARIPSYTSADVHAFVVAIHPATERAYEVRGSLRVVVELCDVNGLGFPLVFIGSLAGHTRDLVPMNAYHLRSFCVNMWQGVPELIYQPGSEMTPLSPQLSSVAVTLSLAYQTACSNAAFHM